MIHNEYLRTREDGVRLFKSYSDKNVYIQKVGTDEVYAEAIDVENCGFTYVETDKAIEEAHDEDTDI